MNRLSSTGILVGVVPIWRALRVDVYRRPLHAVNRPVPDGSVAAGLYGGILSRLEALPGVEDVGAASALPLSGRPSGLAFRVQGQYEDVRQQLPTANYHVITPGHLRVMRIPVVRGREFTDADRDGAIPVAMVSQSLADRFWPGQDPIGQRIGPSWDDEWQTVVGVVGDMSDDSRRVPRRRGNRWRVAPRCGRIPW